MVGAEEGVEQGEPFLLLERTRSEVLGATRIQSLETEFCAFPLTEAVS